MSAASDFRGDYAPGGLTTKGKWRAAGRRGGLASGKKRRQLARGRRSPNARRRPQALSLGKRIKQLSAEQFERLYADMCSREALPFDRRGLNTAYELYRVEMAAYRGQGQLFETTNAQRSRALETRGRRRERRSVQYTRKRLELMGLVSYEHLRRGFVCEGRWRPGPRRDSLRVELIAPRFGANCTPRTRANCTPLTGSGTPCKGVVPDGTSKTATDLIPPPYGGRDCEAASPPSTERARLEAAIAFQQLKLDCGWSRPQTELRIHRLRSDLRAIDEPESRSLDRED